MKYHVVMFSDHRDTPVIAQRPYPILKWYSIYCVYMMDKKPTSDSEDCLRGGGA